MQVLFAHSDSSAFPVWQKRFAKIAPEFELITPEQLNDNSNVRAMIAWQPDVHLIKELPQLELIQSLGMGVDHILQYDEIPAQVKVCRVVDDDMPRQMSEYVLYGVLKAFQKLHQYQQQQNQQHWHVLSREKHHQFPIGIMGYGALGKAVVQRLYDNQFQHLHIWSRSRKTSAIATSYAGAAELDQFLQQSQVLVCLLPLTAETKHILQRKTLAQLPQGAFIINAARGGHLVEDDLLTLVNEQHISGALLDVFQQEPLPEGHPFWQHPAIEVTPHIAAETNIDTVIAQIIDNLSNLRDGLPLHHVVDRQRGY